MDLVTHAATGLLLSQALPRRPLTRWRPFFFMAAACLPDADILLASSPSLFLTLHRGVSHSIFFVPVLALVLALAAWPLRRRKTPDFIPLGQLWGIFCCTLLLHLWLDSITTFGTMIFLPFSSFRVRLNANFIVDLFLTLPLLLLLVASFVKKSRSKAWAAAGLAWIFLYPCCNIVLNVRTTGVLADTLRAQNRQVEQLVVLPDFFTPLFWRALYTENTGDGLVEREASLSGLGTLRGTPTTYTALPKNTETHMAAQSELARDFFRLMLLPVTSPLPERGVNSAMVALSFLSRDEGSTDPHSLRPVEHHEAKELRFLVVHDLRFASGLEFGRMLLGMRPNANTPFMMLVVLDNDDNILLERMVFSDMRMDTGWKSPTAPRPQTLGRWLLGLD